MRGGAVRNHHQEVRKVTPASAGQIFSIAVPEITLPFLVASFFFLMCTVGRCHETQLTLLLLLKIKFIIITKINKFIIVYLVKYLLRCPRGVDQLTRIFCPISPIIFTSLGGWLSPYMKSVFILI